MLLLDKSEFIPAKFQVLTYMGSTLHYTEAGVPTMLLLWLRKGAVRRQSEMDMADETKW